MPLPSVWLQWGKRCSICSQMEPTKSQLQTTHYLELKVTKYILFLFVFVKSNQYIYIQYGHCIPTGGVSICHYPMLLIRKPEVCYKVYIFIKWWSFCRKCILANNHVFQITPCMYNIDNARHSRRLCDLGSIGCAQLLKSAGLI